MGDESVLSKEELDALLERVEQGTVEGDALDQPLPGEVRPYDFAAGGHIVRGPLPALEMIHQRFAKGLPETLYRFIHRQAAADCAPATRLKYEEYLERVGRPALLHRAKAQPTGGDLLVVMDGRLVCTVVDAYFGGPGEDPGDLSDRDFTPAEARVAFRLLGALLDDLASAWNPVAALRFEFVGSESDPAFVQLAAPAEDVFLTRIEVAIGEVRGTLDLVLTETLVEPLLQTLSAGAPSAEEEDPGGWGRRLKSNLYEADVTLSARLASTELPLREILELRVGHILPIEMPRHIPVVVEGVSLFLGEFGEHKGKNAVKILGTAGDPRYLDAGLRPEGHGDDPDHSFQTSIVSDRRNRDEQR